MLLPSRRPEYFPLVELKRELGARGLGAGSALRTCGIHEVQGHIPGHSSAGDGPR